MLAVTESSGSKFGKQVGESPGAWVTKPSLQMLCAGKEKESVRGAEGAPLRFFEFSVP